jgi:hypothetical protein
MVFMSTGVNVVALDIEQNVRRIDLRWVELVRVKE